LRQECKSEPLDLEEEKEDQFKGLKFKEEKVQGRRRRSGALGGG